MPQQIFVDERTNEHFTWTGTPYKNTNDQETLHVLAELKKPRKQRERERIARAYEFNPFPF